MGWCRVFSISAMLMVACSTSGGPGDSDPDARASADSDDAATASDAADVRDSGSANWVRQPVHVPEGFLCNIPPDYVDSGGDPTYVSCDVESDRFSDRDPNQAGASLRVVTWNVRFGEKHAVVLSELTTRAELVSADVVLLQEVARNDLSSSPQGINQARLLAQAMAMDYVFAVEWDRRLNENQAGEHGVAILSKYPIGNVTQLRHVPLNDWYAEDSRFGGRMSLAVDILVGGTLVRVYSSHLDTRPTLPDDSGRAMQGAEVRADADAPGRPSVQIIGGDLNTWTCNPTILNCTTAPDAEQVIIDMLDAGWLDGSAGYTGYTQLGVGFFPQRLDWLLYRGTSVSEGTALTDATGSDHFPLYCDLSLN